MDFTKNLIRTLKRFKQFIDDTKKIRDPDTYTLIQSDEGGEFFNEKLQSLHLENRIKLYITKMNHGHSFLSEQKIREVKKRMTKLKKRTRTAAMKEMIKLTEENMNNTRIGYLGLSPLEIEIKVASRAHDTIKKLYIGK